MIVSVGGRGPRSSYLCSFSQQIFIDYQVSHTLLCGQDMVLNRIGINVFHVVVDKKGHVQFIVRNPWERWHPGLGRTDCMMQSFVPGDAQGSGKLGLTSLWELSAE